MKINLICYTKADIFFPLTSDKKKFKNISVNWEKPTIKEMRLDSTNTGANENYYERVGKTAYYGGS